MRFFFRFISYYGINSTGADWVSFNARLEEEGEGFGVVIVALELES